MITNELCIVDANICICACASDLHTMMNVKLDKFLVEQYYNYEQKFEETKVRLSMELRDVSIFRDLIVWVTSFALKTINAQFKRLKCEPIVIVSCTSIFTKTMKLSCAHKIQERWYDRTNDNVLKLEDIHPHWRFTKSSQTRQTTTRQKNNIAGDNNDEVTKVRETSFEIPSLSFEDR